MAKDKQAWRGAAAPGPVGSTSPAAPGSPSSRKQRLFVLAAAFVALLGVIAAFVYLIRPARSAYFLPVCITEYKNRLVPVNALAEQDRAALAQEHFTNKSANAFASQEKQLLIDELKHLARLGVGEPVVIYLSAFALGDGSGELFILPADADPDQPVTWLKMKDVLQAVKDCPAKQKLLIVDVMRPVADPRLGTLTDDAADRVVALLDQVADPDRLVLLSCAPGQTSLVSDDLKQSVFGYYLDEGLRGWADGYTAEQQRDGRVTVQELARFVKARVDRWARMNRDTRQTPLLFGTGDFELAVLEKAEPKPPRELAAAEAYPDWLAKAWELRDQWWADGTFRRAPHIYRQLELTLLQAERAWRGGIDPAKVQAGLTRDLDGLKSQAAQAAKQIPRPEPKSLALAVQLKKPNPDGPKELKKLIARLDEVGRGLKPDEATAARAKLQEEFLVKFKDLPAVEQAFQVFETAADDTAPSPERITQLYGMLRKFQPLPSYTETLFLRRLDELAALSAKDGRPWPTEVVRRALQVVREGEKAANCDAQVFPWVAAGLERAAQKRHDAETLLFARGSAAPEEAHRLFKESASEYQEINGAADRLQNALRAYDEALAILPAATAVLTDRPEESWKDAVDLTIRLHDFFGQEPGADAQKKLDELQQNADLLRIHLNNLTRPYTTDLPRLVVQVKRLDVADAGTYREVELALATPWLRAKERVELFGAGRALAKTFVDKTRALDQQDGQKRQATELQPEFDSKKGERDEQQRAARRAQLAVDLVRLGGLSVDKLDGALATARRSNTWPALGQDLRKAWSEQAPKQLQESTDLAARARLARVLAAASDGPSPAVELQKKRALDQLRWQGDRYRYAARDLPGLAEGRDAFVRDFFDESAGEYLRDVSAVPNPAFFQFTGSSDVPDFRSDNRSSIYKLQARLSGTAPASAAKEIASAGLDASWLQVAIPDMKLDGAGPWDVPLTVQYKTGPDGAPPDGFLMRASLAGRGFHFRAPILAPVPDNKRLQILVSDSPKEPALSLAELRLRPNARQSVHVWVRNPTDQPRKVAVEVKGEGVPPVTSEPLEIGPMEVKKVSFGKPMPAPPGKAPELPELRGQLQLRLLDADKKNLLDDKKFAVAIANPKEYARVSNIRFEPGAKNKLVVQVRATAPLATPAQVKLVLPPERIPGFVKAESGTFEGLLTADAELTLTAENLLFENVADENGYVYINVDGYERAFVFKITFARRGAPVAPIEVLRPELRIAAPSFLRPGAPCPVRLEVDNAPAAASLEVGIDRNSTGNFTLEPPLPEDRRQRVGFAPVGPEGVPVFETSVADWNISLNMVGIVGTRDLRVRMLDRRGGPITAVAQKVTVDSTPPVDARVVLVGGQSVIDGKPSQVPPNALLPVVAEANDPDSGIEKVVFYLGKPVDGKFPPEAAKKDAEPLNGQKTRWKALLPAASEGAMDVTVEFTNGVGLTTLSKTIAIHIRKPGADDDDKDKKPGSITGVVLEGDRGQPNAEVILFDAKDPKAEPKDKVKTNDKGEFEFKDLKPGSYRVFSAKPVTGRKGEATAIVTPGKATPVKISLLQ